MAWPRSDPAGHWRDIGSSGSARARQGLREMVVHHRVLKRAVTTPLRKGGKETRAGPVICALSGARDGNINHGPENRNPEPRPGSPRGQHP